MKGRGGGDPDGCDPSLAGSRSSVPNRRFEDRADYSRAAGQFERRTDDVSPYAVGRHRPAPPPVADRDHRRARRADALQTDPDRRETFTELLGDPDGTHVALEATYGWEWLAELLEDAGFDVHLAHPLRTRAIAAARVKTDAVDAARSRTCCAPACCPRRTSPRRSCVTCATCCATARRSCTCAPRSRTGCTHCWPARASCPSTPTCSAPPAASTSPPLQLPDGPRRRLDSLIALICDFDREITDTTSEIDQRAKADERVKLLCQIRGIGPYTAMLIIAEIGEVKRFPTAKHLCQWAGLTPTVRSSDGKARLGHISRQGSTILRWALCEAAQHTPTGGGPLRAQYERIAKRRGSKIAKVAVARQILTLCYYGLRDGEIRCLARQPNNVNDELADAA